MTDILKLIEADRPVRLLANAATVEDLRTLIAFWSDEAARDAEVDLSAVSNAELRARLAGEGVDPGMPDVLRANLPAGRIWHLALPALAASIATCAALGLLWLFTLGTGPAITERAPAAAPDRSVLADPDRPAAGSMPSAGPAPSAGLHAASADRQTHDSGLSRGEIFEMQRNLNRLGYGPLTRNGLMSEQLLDAVVRFRADRGLPPDPSQLREVLVMLRQSAWIDALRAPDSQNDTSQKSEGE